MLPALICLPNSSEWSRRVTFKLQPQVRVDFPMRRVEHSVVGALYYLDDCRPVGASSFDLPESAVTLRQHEVVTDQKRHRRSFIVNLSEVACTLLVAPFSARVRSALELHAPVPDPLGVSMIALPKGDALLIPCGHIALRAYGPVVRRDMATLTGDTPYEYDISFDGFVFSGRESLNTVYPYRYARSIAKLVSSPTRCFAARYYSGRMTEAYRLSCVRQ